MGKTTAISWTDHTFNIAWGCEKVSPGCAHCYADTLSTRFGFAIWGKDKERTTFGKKHWLEPMRWNQEAASSGRRQRVFCSSMCDVFENHPTIDQERDLLWPLIRATPNLDWQLLTKRAGRIAQCLPADWGNGYPNVWLGVSAEDQKWLNARMKLSLAVPAAVHFLSVEPMLGKIEFQWDNLSGNPAMWAPDWVIFGGESGPHRRDHKDLPQWIASGVSQCKAAGVAAFVKQDCALRSGQQGRLPDDLFNTKEFPCIIAK